MNVLILSTSLLVLTIVIESHEVLRLPIYNLRRIGITRVVPVTNNYPGSFISNRQTNFKMVTHEAENQLSSSLESMAQYSQSLNHLPSRRMMHLNHAHFINMLPMPRKIGGAQPVHKMNLKLDSYTTKSTRSVPVLTTLPSSLPLKVTSVESLEELPSTTAMTQFPNSEDMTTLKNIGIIEQYSQSLENFERKFYEVTFNKLTAISPPSRRENGMSYVQSGLFLHLALMALSTDVGPEVRREIDDVFGLQASDQEKIELINATVSSLPISSEDLKFRWSSRLVLKSQTVSQQFLTNAAPALRLRVDRLNGNETPKQIAVALNHMVELDSGGAIHDTFDEDDFSGDIRAVLITTLYLRAQWRSAPTLLNGSRPFHDSPNAPLRTVRMIRVNDIMRYADLTELDAEAIEIFYVTPGLSLLMLVPRGSSLRRLADQAANMSLRAITERMQPLRIAATLPLYTLRMTLLLPNKLEAMNITHLLDASGGQSDSFRLSHAVQRIMFWAEAGRNAFKDDGLDWDESPQREIVVDRPYIFYVRWKNKTLMNGNFVL